ncbi:hypothetical protein BGZ95_006578, partial [Linnemannia exigua]
MNNHPLRQSDPRASNESTATIHETIRNIFGSSDSISKEADPKDVNPKEVVSKRVNPKDSNQSTTPFIAERMPQTTPSVAQDHRVLDNIFPKNVTKPVIKAELPRLHHRIERTDQVVYCNTLLLKDPVFSATTNLDKAELVWLEEIKKDPAEQDHLRWLATRMVEAFVADTTKDSTEIAEIVALGPVLQRVPYRKLLTSLLRDLDGARILDDYLLQGLYQLVQTASPGYLEADDLVKILSILRVRMQGMHQQSTEHIYLLALAISGILDVMADHKVQDLDRVLEREPLSGVLSGLKGSSDPYLMYQACYAFQALQYVPDNETALQGVLRHSTGVVDGLVKVTSVFTLDLASILEGLENLKESI